jgi:glycosyltransferase involved in cell wall biosynthesis
MKNAIRVACIKREGMGAGGSERVLQFMAQALASAGYEVDYFYSDSNVDRSRLRAMENAQLKLNEFHIDSVLDDAYGTWEGSNFWDMFDEENYDIIINSIFCGAEYPYHLLKIPVIEFINFGVAVNQSENVIHTFLPSLFLRKKWIGNGGFISTSSVMPVPVEAGCSEVDLREELAIPESAIVAGFHGRISDYTYSDIPLAAFAMVNQPDVYFLIMGLSDKYKKQAKNLGLTNVRFIEHSADPTRISSFLRTLDVFAHGRYDGETYGSIFAEALMHNLPCMSHSSSFDNAQQETMGPHGCFVDGVDEYAEVLAKLLGREDARNALSRGAVDFAKANYSFESVSKDFLSAFDRIVMKSFALREGRFIRKDSFMKRLLFRFFNGI